MEKVYFDSVDTYTKHYGLQSRHPLVATIDFREATQYVNHIEAQGEIYGLYLKNASYCRLKYGRKTYDFQAGTVVSIAPGQTVKIDISTEEISLDVIGIVFHPDFLIGTSLSRKIKDFNFFNYSELESLHLSENEREKFIFYYNIIREELERPIDKHTGNVVTTNILLLLEHLQRFYDRQFNTRQKENSIIVNQFQTNLQEYYSGGYRKSMPSVAYFAEKACLSPGYFSEVIRKVTGTSPKDFITSYIIGEAKRRLLESNVDISEIAYSLGYEYPTHFTRMFKRVVGITPKEYRMKPNS